MSMSKGAAIGAAIILAAALSACSPSGEKAADGSAPAPSGGGGATVSAGDMPKPKVGKWKMTMNIAGAPGPQTVEVCYTQKMIDELQTMSADMPNTDCGEPAFARVDGAFQTTVSCAAHGQKSTVVTRAKGDFNSRYTVEMSMTSDPPTAGANMTTTTVAEFLGPC